MSETKAESSRAPESATGPHAALNRAIARTRGRIVVRRALAAVVWSLTAGLGLLAVLVGIERVFALEIPWAIAAWTVAAGVPVAGLLWTATHLPSCMEAARELDERAHLRDAMATALACARAPGAWSSLVVESAEAQARRVKVREAIPIRRPRGLTGTIAAGAVLAASWFLLPTLDVLGTLAQREREADNQREIRQVRQELEASQARLDDLARRTELDLEADSESFDQDLPEDPRSAEDLRRARVRQLTGLSEKIAEARRGLDAKRAEAIQQSLKQLRQPGEGPLSRMSRLLAQGRTAEAQQSLESLAQQIASGAMDEASRRRAGEQARAMAEQLEKLAEAGERGKRELQQRLEAMGLSEQQIEQMLSDPAAFERALQQMEGLTPEQLQELTDLASQMDAGEQMRQMSRAMERLAKALESGEISQRELNEAIRALQKQYAQPQRLRGQMERLAEADQMVSEELAKLSAALGRKPSARSSGSVAQGTQPGGRKPGSGSVESQGMHLKQFASRKERSPVRSGPGPIIASTLVDGPQIRGESQAAFAEAATSAAQAASEAIDNRAIPRDRQSIVKHYFGAIDRSKDEPANEE